MALSRTPLPRARTRRLALLVVAVCLALPGARAEADLCSNVQDTTTTAETHVDVWFHDELFPDTGYRGDETWNRMVLQCNRKRDTKGNEVAKVTGVTENSAEKRTLKADNLEPKVIRGKYNFHGFIAEQQKYVYILSKTDGVWKMIIPYKASINDLVENRVDFYIGSREIKRDGTLEPVTQTGHAWDIYDESQVRSVSRRRSGREAWRLKDPGKAIPIARTLCSASSPVYFPGKEGKYDGQSGADSYKRDPQNKHISLGRIAYGYKNDDYIRLGCRVDKNRDIFWRPDPDAPRVVKTKPEAFIFNNFVRTAEQHWTLPGVFELEIYLKGVNDSDFPKSTLDLLQENPITQVDPIGVLDPLNVLDGGDYLTVYFATKFMPYQYNQMYKSNPVQFNNFSTMTTDGTYWHEVGHAFGLDDEYGKDDRNDKPKDNGCEYSGYQKYSPTYYQMCEGGRSPDEVKKCESTQGDYCADPRTIYYYLAVSRYITKQNECANDRDCGEGRYCDKGFVTVGKNQCLDEKKDNEPCDILGGAHQCEGKHCAWGRCYTPKSVPMGGVCFVDDACKKGKCSSLDGTKGTCVCKTDEDCGGDKWCNAGVDLVKNACEPLKKDNDTCAAVGGGHQCEGGHCKFSRCYTPNSVPLGGLCYVDDACKEGKCSSIDGTRGTCVCKNDKDCGEGRWCDGGVDLTKNRCQPLKNDNETCAAVGGGHQCKGGRCAWSRCYTPKSVAMGGTCYVDDACKEGKCSSIDGTRGTCVCKVDDDCGTGKWCDSGVDLTKNSCEPLKKDNETCAAAGGGHQCEGGHCAWSRCYTPKSVAMGDTCYVDDACKEGKCSSIDGTKGTCVCKTDSDCGSGKWCDAGLDLKKNKCYDKLKKGETCGKVGSVGNDHKCKSGKCSGFPNYKCK
ncbi:MAG: Dickkopf N-terminal cysteine-rich domain-containing protein [Thermoanaerobaculia bacterium]